jgi:hypothetical protein
VLRVGDDTNLVRPSLSWCLPFKSQKVVRCVGDGSFLRS